MILKNLIAATLLCLFFSCHNVKQEAAEEQEPVIVTPVTVTGISDAPMTEFIELNATSVFLQKAFVKANISGYIESMNTAVGKMVGTGQTLFTIRTKEARSIGNTINLLDTSFRFSGAVSIKAGISGYISEIDHQQGEYVQEGEQLAAISDAGSFVFLLNLPYEFRPYIADKRTVDLTLPDGKILTGNIAGTMPAVDSASQTQQVIIRVKERDIPVNLIAKVRIEKTYRPKAISLPRQAVLSDETQSEFWVMKVTDDHTAVKVPVRKGVETSDRIEILSPAFSQKDSFLLTGNFGLPDTAAIKINQQ